MDWHPIQGGVEIFLVASCHGNRDKLRPGGPLGSYADFTAEGVCIGSLWTRSTVGSTGWGGGGGQCCQANTHMEMK